MRSAILWIFVIAGSIASPMASAQDRDRIMLFGASGCPNLSDWKTFSNAILSGDYKANLPPTCPFLAQHTTVKGPLKKATAGSAKLDLVSVGGRLLWIESGNLK